MGAEPGQSPTPTADRHDPAVYPMDGPMAIADPDANTAIGYDTAGTPKVGGDAPSACLRAPARRLRGACGVRSRMGRQRGAGG